LVKKYKVMFNIPNNFEQLETLFFK